jgi:microcystin-dependent protein
MSRVRLTGSTSGYVEITAPAVAGNNTVTLPSSNGTAGQSLVTDGSGVLSVASVPPSGSIFWFAADAAPTGYLKANGANINRTTYAALFSAIGTTFGVGDGSTTFGLPDLRGEFIRGWDDGRGIDSGRAFGSAQAQAIQSHLHSYRTAYNLGNGIAGFDGTALTGNSVAASYNVHAAIPSQNTDSTGGTETRPRNVALLAIIKF